LPSNRKGTNRFVENNFIGCQLSLVPVQYRTFPTVWNMPGFIFWSEIRVPSLHLHLLPAIGIFLLPTKLYLLTHLFCVIFPFLNIFLRMYYLRKTFPVIFLFSFLMFFFFLISSIFCFMSFKGWGKPIFRCLHISPGNMDRWNLLNTCHFLISFLLFLL
jgi:hypothetical protein